MRFNTNPFVIGYWARYHNLTWDDIQNETPDDATAKAIDTALTAADEAAFEAKKQEVGGDALVAHRLYDDAKKTFAAGWNQCDEELRNARLKELMASLVQANGVTAPADDDQKARRRVLPKRSR